MSIIVAVETLRASLGIAIRKVAVSLHLHVLDINVHGGRYLVLCVQVGRWWRGPSWLGVKECTSFDALVYEDRIVDGLGTLVSGRSSDVSLQTRP